MTWLLKASLLIWNKAGKKRICSCNMNCSCSMEGLRELDSFSLSLDWKVFVTQAWTGEEAVLAFRQGNFVVLLKDGLVALENCSEKSRWRNELRILGLNLNVLQNLKKIFFTVAWTHVWFVLKYVRIWTIYTFLGLTKSCFLVKRAIVVNTLWKLESSCPSTIPVLQYHCCVM